MVLMLKLQEKISFMLSAKWQTRKFSNMVTCILQVFFLNVYTLPDPCATLSYVTLLIS